MVEFLKTLILKGSAAMFTVLVVTGIIFVAAAITFVYCVKKLKELLEDLDS